MFSRARAKRELRRAQLCLTKAPPKLPDIPKSFAAFCTDTLGLRLSRGQRVLALVAYDGVDPIDLPEEDRATARQLFGDVDRVPEGARTTIVEVCGGRGGKSYLGALRLVHGMFRRDLSSVAPGQRAVALCIAPSEELRQEIINYAVGAIRSSALRPALIVPKGTGADDTVSRFSIRRADGAIVAFRAGVATRGGYGGRGKSLTDFLMDEAAFFRDASSKVNDEEIYKAASPRVLPGGQSIVKSTPWGEAGMLYDFHARCFGKPDGALVAHAPTLLLNDAPWVATIVAREYARDPDNARREFGALFMAGGTLLFFEGSTIEAAKTVTNPIRDPKDLRGGDIIRAGGDLGFVSDSAALVIVVVRDGVSYVASILELRPQAGAPLEPGEVVRKFAEEMKRWGVEYLMADGHYRQSLIEHLAKHGLKYVPAPSTPSEPYVATRGLLRSSRLVLPDDHRLVQQMREVQSRTRSGGGLSIIHPRWATGGHGDICAGLVLAVDQPGGTKLPPEPLKPGTDAYEQKRRDDRIARLKAEAEKEKRRYAA
jgi:hypothetical protein